MYAMYNRLQTCRLRALDTLNETLRFIPYNEEKPDTQLRGFLNHAASG
jgi:hypothetical protein